MEANHCGHKRLAGTGQECFFRPEWPLKSGTDRNGPVLKLVRFNGVPVPAL